MKRWLIEHGVYVVLSLALSGAGVYFLLHLTRDADANSATLLVTQKKLDTALDKINQPCITVKGQKLTEDDDKPCGTLADINQTLRTIRGAAGQLEVAGRHENKNLDALDKQEAQLAQRLNDTLDALKGTANAATGTLQQGRTDLATMNDSIAETKPLVQASTATVKHYDAMAPTIAATAGNVQHMTLDGARITKDAADEADKLAHPPKKKLGFWGGFWVGMQYVHKMMPSIF